MALGVPAAAAGAGIYYGIVALTGYEFGLVAIVIGLLVGGAVRIGAGGRGGWLYQAMAVTLTYVAIVSTYIPYIIGGWDEEAPVEQSLDTEIMIGTGQTGGEPASAPLSTMDPQNPDLSSDDAVFPGDETQHDNFDNGSAEFPLVLSLWVVFMIAMVAPFLSGFDNIIGIIIIAIGLYEAWKINKRAKIPINGPFSLTDGSASSESVAGNG
jgi:hypothetical protein